MPMEYGSKSANTEDWQFKQREIYTSKISAFNPMQNMDPWPSPKGELPILLAGLIYTDVLPLQSFHASPAVSVTKNPYTVLKVDKNASLSDIKKAYYAMAKKYHPDSNKDPKAKDRFSESQTAYEMLSDPKKKEAWDQYGSAVFDQGARFDPSAGPGPFGGAPGGSGFGKEFGGGFGTAINFEDLLGAFTGQGRKAKGPRQSSVHESFLIGQDIEVQVHISFMEAAKGTVKDVSINPKVKCRSCSGEGLKSGKSRSSCKKCGGSGTFFQFLQPGLQFQGTCEACEGAGVVTPRGAECGTCHGSGTYRERTTVPVRFLGGVEDGTYFRVTGAGDAPPIGSVLNPDVHTVNGDLIVLVGVARDSKFSRSGADVYYTASIPLTTAALGGEIIVPTLGDDVKVKVDMGTETGDSVTLAGMGVPKTGNGRSGTGDLRVKFKVSMPKFLDSNQMTILETLAESMQDQTAKRIMTIRNAR